MHQKRSTQTHTGHTSKLCRAHKTDGCYVTALMMVARQFYIQRCVAIIVIGWASVARCTNTSRPYSRQSRRLVSDGACLVVARHLAPQHTPSATVAAQPTAPPPRRHIPPRPPRPPCANLPICTAARPARRALPAERHASHAMEHPRATPPQRPTWHPRVAAMALAL